MATTINDSNKSTAAAAAQRVLERRREFVRQQEAQRRTFHDQTSFKVFPLQSLAIQDYDDLMRVYRADEAKTASSSNKNNKDEEQSKQNTHCHSSSEESNLNYTVVDEVKQDVVLQQESLHHHKSSSSSTLSTFLWSKQPRLFAMETTLCGKRRYISSHLGRFMDQYWKECNVDTRHYYELIKEDVPCRLYFGELEQILVNIAHKHA